MIRETEVAGMAEGCKQYEASCEFKPVQYQMHHGAEIAATSPEYLAHRLLVEFGKTRTNYNSLVPRIVEVMRLYRDFGALRCPVPVVSNLDDLLNDEALMRIESRYPASLDAGFLVLCTEKRALRSGGGGKYYFMDSKNGRLVGCHKSDLPHYLERGVLTGGPVLLKNLIFVFIMKGTYGLDPRCKSSNPQRLLDFYESLVKENKTSEVQRLMRVWSMEIHPEPPYDSGFPHCTLLWVKRMDMANHVNKWKYSQWQAGQFRIRDQLYSKNRCLGYSAPDIYDFKRQAEYSNGSSIIKRRRTEGFTAVAYEPLYRPNIHAAPFNRFSLESGKFCTDSLSATIPASELSWDQYSVEIMYSNFTEISQLLTTADILDWSSHILSKLSFPVLDATLQLITTMFGAVAPPVVSTINADTLRHSILAVLYDLGHSKEQLREALRLFMACLIRQCQISSEPGADHFLPSEIPSEDPSLLSTGGASFSPLRTEYAASLPTLPSMPELSSTATTASTEDGLLSALLELEDRGGAYPSVHSFFSPPVNELQQQQASVMMVKCEPAADGETEDEEALVVCVEAGSKTISWDTIPLETLLPGQASSTSHERLFRRSLLACGWHGAPQYHSGHQRSNSAPPVPGGLSRTPRNDSSKTHSPRTHSLTTQRPRTQRPRSQSLKTQSLNSPPPAPRSLSPYRQKLQSARLDCCRQKLEGTPLEHSLASLALQSLKYCNADARGFVKEETLQQNKEEEEETLQPKCLQFLQASYEKENAAPIDVTTNLPATHYSNCHSTSSYIAIGYPSTGQDNNYFENRARVYENLAEHSVERPVDRSGDRPGDRPVDDQFVDRPVDQFVDRPVDHFVDRPVDQFVDRPVDQFVDRPVDQFVDRPVDQFVDRPVDQFVDRPVDHPVDRDFLARNYSYNTRLLKEREQPIDFTDSIPMHVSDPQSLQAPHSLWHLPANSVDFVNARYTFKQEEEPRVSTLASALALQEYNNQQFLIGNAGLGYEVQSGMPAASSTTEPLEMGVPSTPVLYRGEVQERYALGCIDPCYVGGHTKQQHYVAHGENWPLCKPTGEMLQRERYTQQATAGDMDTQMHHQLDSVDSDVSSHYYDQSLIQPVMLAS